MNEDDVMKSIASIRISPFTDCRSMRQNIAWNQKDSPSTKSKEKSRIISTFMSSNFIISQFIFYCKIT
jgi:hypothetical protein